jgi:CRISPR-associated endonuclease Csn1
LKIAGNEPSDIIDMGVRIFPDGRDAQSKTPLAVNRRQKRGMRRSLDRRKLRKKRLMDYLLSAGLMPTDRADRKELEKINPYQLRSDALDKKLSLHELGRALFHVCQRRGFKSNRKSDKKEKDSGNMKKSIAELSEKMEGIKARTLGEYLFLLGKTDVQKVNPQSAPIHVPLRVQATQVKGKNVYNLYPSRKMYEDEVSLVLDTQKKHHPELTEGVIAKIKDIIFFQRNLRPQEVGWCRFENGQKRMRKAYPLFQHFRILQEVNNLDLERFGEGEEGLTREQKIKLIKELKKSKDMTFNKIRKLLGLSDGAKFNLEAENRDRLQGDETAYAFSSDKKNECFGKAWLDLSPEKQDSIITKIMEEENEKALVSWLMDNFSVDEQQAENIANVSLDEDFGSLSLKAVEKILPHLEEGYIYSDACQKAGYHHSDFRTGEIFDELPYYGQLLENTVIGGSRNEKDKEQPEKYYGKINNPTVHIALNQLRRLANALIEKYGHPAEIVIELARDLPLGEEGLAELKSEQAKNKKRNDKINEELAKLGVKQNYINRLQYKLWEDLASDPAKRCCPFTGRIIALHQIFSGEFEIEHLLPFSKSFNDSPANKTLSHRDANRLKSNRSPYEAFGDSPLGYNWEEISARASNLPDNKRWRFYPNAWDLVKGKEGDIIARMLVDTQHMARVSKQYLSFICNPDKVWTTPGRLTAMMRDKWGLNDLLGEEDGQKERGDHRHHAIDAFVIACTTRGMLNKISGAANRMYENDALYSKRLKLVEKMPEPFAAYYQRIEDMVENIVISYKPDHGNAHRAITSERPFTVAPLHQETAMGYVGEGAKKGAGVYVTRMFLSQMLAKSDVECIADAKIKERLLEKLAGKEEKSEGWKKALQEFSDEWNIRRLRIHIEKTNDAMVGIRKKGKPDSEPYKYYAMGGNYCAEIFCPSKGKNAGKWDIEIIPDYYAHQKNFVQQWRKDHPTAKLMMRLQIDDMVAYEDDGKTIYTRVKKMSQPGRIYLRPHNVAKEQADKLSWGAFASGLQEKKARKISVDILGYIKDPMGKHDRADHRNNKGRLPSGP